MGSWFEQALVARRQDAHVYTAQTKVSFDPDTYQQNAGLTTYYNRFKYHFLGLTLDEEAGRCLRIMSCPGAYPEGRMEQLIAPVPVGDGPVEMRVEVNNAHQQFFWRQGDDWQAIGPVLDASVISDEGGRGGHGSFTGAFVGMAAFDISGRGQPADFDYFTYTPDEK